MVPPKMQEQLKRAKVQTKSKNDVTKGQTVSVSPKELLSLAVESIPNASNRPLPKPSTSHQGMPLKPAPPVQHREIANANNHGDSRTLGTKTRDDNQAALKHDMQPVPRTDETLVTNDVKKQRTPTKLESTGVPTPPTPVATQVSIPPTPVATQVSTPPILNMHTLCITSAIPVRMLEGLELPQLDFSAFLPHPRGYNDASLKQFLLHNSSKKDIENDRVM